MASKQTVFSRYMQAGNIIISVGFEVLTVVIFSNKTPDSPEMTVDYHRTTPSYIPEYRTIRHYFYKDMETEKRTPKLNPRYFVPKLYDTPCSLIEDYLCFGGIRCLHLQRRGIIQTSNNQEAKRDFLFACLSISGLKRKAVRFSKNKLISSRLYGITSYNILPHIVRDVRTSNSLLCLLFSNYRWSILSSSFSVKLF
jgi:hypothetical protein